MNVLVTYIAFTWDNPQGASGIYVEKKSLFEIHSDVAVFCVLDIIHDKIKKELRISRSFDQTVYSKTQGEYNIKTIEIL